MIFHNIAEDILLSAGKRARTIFDGAKRARVARKLRKEHKGGSSGPKEIQ
jgi:hypothetical protein